MRNKLFISALATLLVLGSFGFAVAAPSLIYQRTVLPETTNTYELGTTTAKWFRIAGSYASTTQVSADSLCLNSDICRTTWPTGAPFPYTIASYGVSSTTIHGFIGGLMSMASSTFTSALRLSSLGTGSVGIAEGGLLYSAATTTFSGGLTYAAGNVTNTITAGDGITRNTDDLDCDTASGSVFGCLSSADWGIFNNKISTSSLSATTPLIYNSATGAFTFVGLATTSQPASSNLLVSNGGAGVFGVATSTTGTASTILALDASAHSVLPYASTTALTVSGDFYPDNGTGIWNSSGNVGIGSTSPSTTLGVVGNGYFTGTLGIGEAAPTTAPFDVNKVTNFAVAAKFGATSPVYLMANNPTVGFNMYWKGGGNFAFGAGSTAEYGGSLAFDDTTGTYQWTVSNGTGAAGDTLTATNLMSLSRNNVLTVAYASSTALTVSGDFYPDNGSGIWNSSGNVGIGTTTPTAKLHLNATDNTELLRLSSTGAPSLYHLKISGVTTATADYRFQAVNNGSATDVLYLKGTGNVGIGTTTPTWLLNPSSATASQLALSSGAGFSQWAFRNAGGNLYIATTTVAGTATSSMSALTINPNGFLGIGTTTPGTFLSIGNGANFINLSPTATSTFGSGINIKSGCFSINGTCVGGAGGGNTKTVVTESCSLSRSYNQLDVVSDATTYYTGRNDTTTATYTEGVMLGIGAAPCTGYITSATFASHKEVKGSSENSVISVAVNGTSTTTLMSTVKMDAFTNTASMTSAYIAVTVGDLITIQWVTPTFVTNPQYVSITPSVHIVATTTVSSP